MMKMNEIETAIIELRRIKQAWSRWEPRITQALEDVESLQKRPIIEELVQLTGEPETDYNKESLEDLKKMLNVVRKTHQKSKKESDRMKNDPAIG